MADIGSAYLTIFPSMDGFGSKLMSELNGVNVSAIGDKLGDQLGDGISDGMDKATKSTSGFSGKLSALSGAVMGVAGEIAGRLFDAVASLGGEMVEASDSAQKFASTLSFAGIDDSAIQQLTASTQEYADRTVYDLADIRNATAQLAANGVANYAQLAEAAGNLNAVAGGNAETFKSVSMVMSQTAGSGKLMTENWNQLTDAIPGASGALQEAMRSAGAFEGNFREAMENGEISADEFFAAVQKLGMQDVAVQAATSTSTIEGALGNLQASVVGVGSQAITALNPIITGAMNQLTGFISGVPGAFTGLATALAPLGAAFAPIMTALTNLATTVGPLIIPLVQQLSALIVGFLPVLTSVGTVIATIVSAVINFAAQVLAIVLPVVTQIVSTITANMPLIQSIITNAMMILMTIFNTVWPAIQGVVTTVMGVISSIISTVWPAIEGIISGVLGAINAVISSVLSIIQGDWQGAWDTMSSFLSSAWEGIKSGVSAGIDAVMSFLGSLPGQIIGIFSGAGSWLVESGKSLLQGFADGVMGAVGWVGDQISGALDTIRGFFPFSPAKEGPFSGHGYTTYSGRALMTDFGKGIAQASGSAVSAAIGAVGDVEGVFSGASAEFGTIGSASLGAYASASGEEPTADALLRSIDDGIAYIAQLLPEALDPATRARFARGAVSYAY